MSAMDIPAIGSRAPEIIATWNDGQYEHRLVYSKASLEFRAEKRHRYGGRTFRAYFWTKSPSRVAEFKRENGL